MVTRLETGSQAKLAVCRLAITAAMSTSPPPSGWSPTPHNHHPPFNQFGDILIPYNYNQNSAEYFFQYYELQGYLTIPNQLFTLMYHPELMCTKRKLSYKKYAEIAVFSRGLSYPLFAMVMETVSTFFCGSIPHLNVTTTPIIASITEA